MAKQKLPININGPFAHFYPGSEIEIPDEFWARLRQELYPPDGFRPPNTIEVYYEGTIEVDALADELFGILTLSEKQHALIYLMWLLPDSASAAVDSIWYIYINDTVIEKRGCNAWKNLGSGITNADYVHFLLKPNDTLEAKFYNRKTADTFKASLIVRGYRWTEI